LVVHLHVFGSKSTISRFGERLRDGQYSLVSFLFAVLLLTVPPCPFICKSGGHVSAPRHGQIGSFVIFPSHAVKYSNSTEVVEICGLHEVK